jgi:hypothetical protein
VSSFVFGLLCTDILIRAVYVVFTLFLCFLTFSSCIVAVNNQYFYQSGGSRQGSVNDVRRLVLPDYYPLTPSQDMIAAGTGCLQLPSVQALGSNRPKSPSLLIVILPQTAADLRTAVKHFGDVSMGVPTQCIVRFCYWWNVS